MAGVTTVTLYNKGCLTVGNSGFRALLRFPGRDPFWLSVGGIASNNSSDANLPTNTSFTGELWRMTSSSDPFGSDTRQVKVADFSGTTGASANTLIIIGQDASGNCGVMQILQQSLAEYQARVGTPRGAPPVVTTLQAPAAQPPQVIVVKQSWSWLWWIVLIVAIYLLIRHMRKRTA